MKKKQIKAIFKALTELDYMDGEYFKGEEKAMFFQDMKTYFADKKAKKKAKFGSDKEQVKLKEEPQEKTFEEWKALFPIGSKARAKNDHGEYVKKGEIIDIEDYSNVPDDKVNNFIAVVFKKFFLCPIDNLEPIQESSFKVGDKVEIIGGMCKGEKAIVLEFDNLTDSFRLWLLDSKKTCLKSILHLKLLPND